MNYTSLLQEGRTCDWEWFKGREELSHQLGNLSEPWKTRETRELKKKIRREYDVPLPEDDVLYGKVLDDYRRERGTPGRAPTTDDLIDYWRANHTKYPPAITRAQKDEMRRMLEKQQELEREREQEGRGRFR
jgi:hypothetical protein